MKNWALGEDNLGRVSDPKLSIILAYAPVVKIAHCKKIIRFPRCTNAMHYSKSFLGNPNQSVQGVHQVFLLIFGLLRLVAQVGYSQPAETGRAWNSHAHSEMLNCGSQVWNKIQYIAGAIFFRQGYSTQETHAMYNLHVQLFLPFRCFCDDSTLSRKWCHLPHWCPMYWSGKHPPVVHTLHWYIFLSSFNGCWCYLSWYEAIYMCSNSLI